MRYQISHTTHYRYGKPVHLDVHTVRLRPRCDGSQQLRHFAISFSPQPERISEILDIEGNAILRIWFPKGLTTELKIHTEADVETLRANPFDYLSEPWAISAPIDYPSVIARQLLPYLQPALTTYLHPAVIEFAQSLLAEVHGNVGIFLSRLTQTIYDDFQYCHRPEGDPQIAAITLEKKAGSCRDFAVLFVETCQAVGLAARFVSGYQEGDDDQEQRELHAWPEVYIPGGGWRGFDPTHGLAVCDRHVPLAAAANPQNAAPVSGRLKPGFFCESTFTYSIHIARSIAGE